MAGVPLSSRMGFLGDDYMEIIYNQCLHCALYVWLKPLSDETFAFCRDGETAEDIDLQSGISPKVEKHLRQGAYCFSFCAGSSISRTSPEAPFKLHPLRKAGEVYLSGILNGAG